jgi:hypothetical protein
MKRLFREAEHLVRLVLVLVVGLVVFFIVRRAVVPAGFGQYGHFRPGALDDNRNRPVRYAGHAECELCHEPVLALKKTGKHARVSCEACHGPQARHASADDPSAMKPRLPDTTSLCKRCHEADIAKPKAFPQVVSKEHSGGQPCGSCHRPHRPNFT